jgi:hypothetical protein
VVVWVAGSMMEILVIEQVVLAVVVLVLMAQL